MKKVGIAVVVMFLLLGGGAWYVFVNLDALVKRGIETAGSDAVGTAVRVESVDVDLATGSAIITGFTVANPEGFSDAAMLSFSELVVVLDTARLSREAIGIHSITARNPRVLFEKRGNLTNLDVVAERLQGPPVPATVEPGVPAVQLAIGTLTIEDIAATLVADVLPQPVDVSLGDIHLQNLQGTPQELARQILRPVMAQLARNAALSLLSVSAGELGAQILQHASEELEAVGEAIDNFFNRNTEPTTPVSQPPAQDAQ